jgi:hypothetical protein
MTAGSVVLLVGAPVDPAAVILPALDGRTVDELIGEAVGRPVVVSLVSWLPAASRIPGVTDAVSLASEPRPRVDRMLARVGAGAITRRLARSPAGRLLNSVGPADQTRAFLRSTRSVETAAAIIAGGDIVIAVDVPATLTAWESLHRGSASRAYYGVRSAVSSLATTTP